MPFTRSARFAVIAATGLAACSANVTGQGPIAAQNEITVDVQPPAAEVVPGGSVSFGAVVTGTADSAVTWSVQEGAAGGTVSSAGVYTAPAATGTYHVIATSHADKSKKHSVPVKVTTTPSVTVAIAPHTTSLVVGGSLTFTATVTGTSNTAVSWSVQEASACGSVTQAGVYTAPPAAATCHVVATSSADGTKSDAATVTVSALPPPVAVAISPPSATTNSCQSVTFSATVTGTSNTAVTWSVQEGAAGGSMTAGGVYTAPPTAGTYHVVATSQADPTRTNVAAIAVSDKILSVTISPQQVTVPPSGSAQFTATITTTCGTTAATGTVAANGAVSAN